MYYNKVEICGINTSELKVLSDDEKRRLLVLAKSGDEAARRELIDGNLRLVLRIIQRFSQHRDDMDDLFQVGCIGLIKAVDNFNVEMDVKFSTYAVPMIIGELRRYLRDNNIIRVSRSMRDLAYKALQARDELAKKSGAEPSIDAIVAELNKKDFKVEKAKVVEAMESIVEPISLFEPVYNDSGGESLYVLDQLSDKSASNDAWLDTISLNDAMKSLGDRERKIISMRFFAGKTQMEIADEIGISQAQVSRLEKGAIKKIRDQM